jgi:hypothetical protein
MQQVLIEKPQTSIGSSKQIGINDNDKVKVLGFDLSQFSQTLQFIICCIAVFFFYLIYGYMQVSYHQ